MSIYGSVLNSCIYISLYPWYLKPWHELYLKKSRPLDIGQTLGKEGLLGFFMQDIFLVFMAKYNNIYKIESTLWNYQMPWMASIITVGTLF